MVNFRNPTDRALHVPGTEAGICLPGEIIAVPDGYALPRKQVNGEKRPSVMDQICPQLEPADAEAVSRIAGEYAEEATDPRRARSMGAPRVRDEYVRQGYSPAMAELMAAKDAQKAAEAAKAQKAAKAK